MLGSNGLTKKTQKTTLERSEPATSAFHKIKNALASSTMLSHPQPDAELCLMTDASDVAAVLCLGSFQNASNPPKSKTAHSVLNSSQSTFPFVTFDTTLKNVSSLCWPTTSRWPTLYIILSTGIPLVKFDIWFSFSNSPQIVATLAALQPSCRRLVTHRHFNSFYQHYWFRSHRFSSSQW